MKLKKVFDAADRSGDGEVDIHEFLMYLDVERLKLIEHIFRQFDARGRFINLKSSRWRCGPSRLSTSTASGGSHDEPDARATGALTASTALGFRISSKAFLAKATSVEGERARNELERIRREEVRRVDRCQWRSSSAARDFRTSSRVGGCMTQRVIRDASFDAGRGKRKSSLGPLTDAPRLCGKTWV